MKPIPNDDLTLLGKYDRIPAIHWIMLLVVANLMIMLDRFLLRHPMQISIELNVSLISAGICTIGGVLLIACCGLLGVFKILDARGGER